METQSPPKRTRVATYMANQYKTKEGRAKQQLKYYKKKWQNNEEAHAIMTDPDTTYVQKLFKIKELNFHLSTQ